MLTLSPSRWWLTACFVLAGCTDDPVTAPAVIEAPICVEHSPTLFGIDVSKWQGDIDWPRVAADGVKYAFIRVSDGITTIDQKFPQNWIGARENGIPRGVYQFFRPNRDAVEQAHIVIDHLDVYGMGELPPVIDVEATGDQPPEVVAAQVGLWIEEIETNLGVRPIIYSGSYFWDDHVESTAFSDYPFWIAHYTSASCPRLPQAWSDWTFWQYSSSGRVDGINGDVDMNRYVGDEVELLELVPDERCRLDPGWRACEGDAVAACVDGRVVSTRCGAGASCVDAQCVADQPEVIEPGPEPQPEVVETPPEVAEPAPEVVTPADTADPATPPVPTTSALTPSRTLNARRVTPAEGCAGGSVPPWWLMAIAIAARSRAWWTG